MQRHSLAVDRDLLRLCLFARFLRNKSHTQHVFQNLIAACQRIFRMTVRVVIRRRVRNRTQICRLAQGQFIRILAKITSCSRLKPVVCVREADIIDIELHNLLFGVFLRQI